MPQRLLLFTNTANTHPKYFVEYYYLGPDHPQMVQMIDLKPEIRDPTECIDILILSSGRAQYNQSIGRVHNERIVSLSRSEITCKRQIFLALWNG